MGSRVALEVARQGLRVALVDAGDFGGATSSASSKLIHGGLRYLSTGQFRVVRSSLAERRALQRHVAPHLVTGLPLIVAVP
ncbi:MAG TPA: FAD-dependent oxidoreductase, partial [Gaiellaceae bacterium]|nr:FAD-dependent oxidoreductase [Gaiellaceae bacterium]